MGESKMKRLLFVATAAMLLTGTTGCRNMCDWFHRGPAYQQQAQVAPVVTCPTVSACDPCADPCSTGAVVTPGTTFTPTPAGR